jgi:predicted nucleic acid-binding protein
MADLLVDTDVLIDHLRGHSAFHARRNRIFYSVVTRCELFAGRDVDEDVVRRLLGAFAEIGLDRTVAEAAGRIRRSAAIPLPDAIIAASAVDFGMPVVTRNRRHFERVPGLRIRAPG